MPSTYSPDLRLELIANGEQDATWGTTTNLNLGTLIEQAIAGVASVSTSSAAQALTVQNGASDQSRCAVLSLSTLGGANYAVYVPPVPKLYVVKNSDTTYNLTLYVSTIAGNTTAAGSGVTLAPGKSALLRSDGTNIIDQINYVSGGFNVGGSFGAAGAATFGSTVTLSGNPTLALQAAPKQYVDAAVAGGVPSGAIIMWSGSIATIPSGWLLCNGTSGTPDLRNRFIIGAYADSAGVASTTITGSNTQTGGSKDATLVSHTHTASSSVTDPGHRHGEQYNNNYSGNQGYVSSFGLGSSISGINPSNSGSATANQVLTDSATTGISVSTSISSAGSSGTNANLVPYYALAFIMKA